MSGDKDMLQLDSEKVRLYNVMKPGRSEPEIMGIDELKVIATELLNQIRASVTIDWTVRESARAAIRVRVRRILKQHGYPPDLQDEATRLVPEQAEVLCCDWTQ